MTTKIVFGHPQRAASHVDWAREVLADGVTVGFLVKDVTEHGSWRGGYRFVDKPATPTDASVDGETLEVFTTVPAARMALAERYSTTTPGAA